MGIARPELYVHHPAPSKVSEDGMEAELVIVGKLGSFLFGISVVVDDRINVHADPGAVLIVVYVLGLHPDIMPKTLRALRQLFFQPGFQAQALKPLPEDLGGGDSLDAQDVLKELVLAELFDVIEVGFPLAQKATQGSENFAVRYLWLLGLAYLMTQFIYTAYSGEFADQSQPGMSELRRAVVQYLAYGHTHPPPCTLWVRHWP